MSVKRSSVFLEVYALGQAVRQLLVAMLADGPLTPEEYAIYSVVFEAESITPTEMGRRLGLPKTTVMERLRLMEERAHVGHLPHPRDGRSYRVVLTAAGLVAHRRANQLFEQAHRAFLKEFAGNEGRAQARLVQLRVAVTMALARQRGAERRRSRKGTTAGGQRDKEGTGRDAGVQGVRDRA